MIELLENVNATPSNFASLRLDLKSAETYANPGRKDLIPIILQFLRRPHVRSWTPLMSTHLQGQQRKQRWTFLPKVQASGLA